MLRGAMRGVPEQRAFLETSSRFASRVVEIYLVWRVTC